MMTREMVEQVRGIQTSMVESGASCFLESQLDGVRVLIRLTVEFFHHLQAEQMAPLAEDELRYACDSVFSGVDSFCLVDAAYRVLTGARQTTLAQRVESIESLKEKFVSMYREFSSETDFEKRCRLLLDLFKLQVVFAGLTYG